jgi:hypothetical protein
MRAYVTILDGEDKLLPFFVRYYLRLGATSFHILNYGEVEVCGRAVDTIIENGGKPVVIDSLSQKTFSARLREATIREYHPNNTWAFFTDLDEFPKITKEEIESQIEAGYPYIYGSWLDRVAMDGALVDPDPKRPLEDTYPGIAKIREGLGMGGFAYICSPFAPTLHHPNVCRTGSKLIRDCMGVMQIHHFKWQGNIIERLTRRLERINRMAPHQYAWKKRVIRQIDWLKKHNGVEKSFISHGGRILGI